MLDQVLIPRPYIHRGDMDPCFSLGLSPGSQAHQSQITHRSWNQSWASGPPVPWDTQDPILRDGVEVGHTYFQALQVQLIAVLYQPSTASDHLKQTDTGISAQTTQGQGLHTELDHRVLLHQELFVTLRAQPSIRGVALQEGLHPRGVIGRGNDEVPHIMKATGGAVTVQHDTQPLQTAGVYAEVGALQHPVEGCEDFVVLCDWLHWSHWICLQ